MLEEKRIVKILNEFIVTATYEDDINNFADAMFILMNKLQINEQTEVALKNLLKQESDIKMKSIYTILLEFIDDMR